MCFIAVPRLNFIVMFALRVYPLHSLIKRSLITGLKCQLVIKYFVTLQSQHAVVLS